MSYRMKSGPREERSGHGGFIPTFIRKRGRLSIFVGLPLVASFAAAADPASTATKIEFVLVAPALRGDSLGARAKVLYLAGNNYARIEQPTDVFSKRKNLIIVNNRDVWTVDARTRTGKHQLNHDTDSTVHNPILGPDSPIALRNLEYGHETEFVDYSKAISLGRKRIGTAECNLYETKSGDYRIRFYIHAKTRCPVLLEVFKAEDTILHINYLSYETGLPFDAAMFVPPKGITFVEEQK